MAASKDELEERIDRLHASGLVDLHFDLLMDFCVSQGSSVNQYKTPRCVKSGGALEILDSRVIGRFFSQRVPQWEPLGLDS